MRFAETQECKRGHISRSSFMFNRRCEKEKGNILFAYVLRSVDETIFEYLSIFGSFQLLLHVHLYILLVQFKLVFCID